MYFTLINNIKYESDISIFEPKNIPFGINFISGNIISASIDNPMVFTTDAKAGDTLRDFFDASYPIISKRFLDLLTNSGVDNLQIFPAIVKSEIDGTIWDDYFSINILGLISCADLSKSTYSEIMPGHYRFKELAINAEKAHGALLFRLKEHSPTIIMHRSVGRYIKEHDPDKTLLGWSVGQIIQ